MPWERPRTLGDSTFNNQLKLYEAEAFSYRSEDLPILIIKKDKQENKTLAFASINQGIFCVSVLRLYRYFFTILYNASFLLTDSVRKQTEGIVLKCHFLE